MRASKRADGTTGSPRHTLVTGSPDGKEWCKGGPQTDVVDVRATVETATRGLLELPHTPKWLVEKGNHLSPELEAPESET